MGAFDYGSSSTSTASRWITNPKHLNAIAAPKGQIYAKTSATTSQASSAAGFFTAIALRGAQTSIASANTFVTVANLKGAGFAFNFISPTHDGGTFTPTIRITVDGVVYTVTPSAAFAIGARLVLGPTTNGSISLSTAAAVGPDIPGVNSPADCGFQGSMVGGVPTMGGAGNNIGIPTPDWIQSLGMQALRFEQSLKVEMACDNLSATAVDKQCAVTYRLDL